MADEMFRSTRPATDVDIAEFMNPDTPAFQEGSRHDDTSRGYFNAESQQAPQFDAYVPPTDPSFNDGIRNDADHWRQQYGRSENEKGDLRRELASQRELLERVSNELAALRAVPPAQPATSPAPAPQQYQVPNTFFEGRKAEDLLEVGEVDALLRTVFAPAVLGVMAQQEQLLKTQIEATKRSAGITPAIEQRLVAAYSWLNSISNPAERVQSMAQLLEMSKQPQLQQQRPPVDPAAAAARRVTYVEPSQPSGASRDEGIPVEQRIAQEFNAARTAAEKRAVLMKYGAQEANDWGSNILTR